ncbi:MAG: hypothetical protein KC912_22845 [Proteobacteria bacterium]|nr:hypothetical protein [Pseudomonadota bacterium]
MSLLLLGLSLVASAAEPTPVEFVGVTHLDVEDVREAFATDGAGLDGVLDAYRDRGFLAVRGWVDESAAGTVVEIDEGRLDRVALVGASAYRQLLLSDNVHLAGQVLHEPSLIRELAGLESQPGVREVSWTLAEGRDLVPTVSGRLVPEQVLQVGLTTLEDRGVDLDLGVDPTWGFLIGAQFDAGLFSDTDHLDGGVLIAFPLQEYVFEQEPQFRWVHGVADLGYRTPWLPGTQVAPRIATRVELSNYSRPFDGLLQGGVIANAAEVSLDFRAGPAVRYSFGPVFEAARVAYMRLQEGASPLDTDQAVTRAGLFARAEWVLDDQTLRADLRDGLSVDLAGLFTGRGEPHLRATLEGQAVTHLGRSLVLARLRALWRGGDVRFFDEEPLAGKWQRVFFQGRYWTRSAAQLELALRLPVSRDVKLGVFHDASVFQHASDDQVLLVNAMGPGLHVLIASQFALDLFYGVGASESGWSHNLSIALKSAY